MTNLVPCGKCPDCQKQKRDAWGFRLYTEMKRSFNPRMVTFTYDNDHIPEYGLLNKKHFQAFMKRIRESGYRKQLKYFVRGEYGDHSQRPHYHAIMYNLKKEHANKPDFIEKHWKNGMIHLAPLNMATIYYTLKYLTKDKIFDLGDVPREHYEFTMMSKGIGLNYLTPAMRNYLTQNMTAAATLPGGIKTPLPRYFKEKVFTPAERSVISIEGLKEAEKRELDLFINEHHKIQWKKDQYRIREKLLQERKSLSGTNSIRTTMDGQTVINPRNL